MWLTTWGCIKSKIDDFLLKVPFWCASRHIYIYAYPYIIHMYILVRSTLSRNFFEQRTTTSRVTSNEKTTTALIIVNNSTFTLSILAYFFVTNFEPWPRAITNFFACCNRLNERFFVYIMKVASIKRIKVGTSEYLVIFRCIYVCVCTSFLPIKSTHFIDTVNTPEQRQAAVISLRWNPYKYRMLKILNKTVFFHY